MEANQYYCRNEMQQNSSPSISQPPLSKMNYVNNGGQEYVACSSNHSESGYNSSDMPPRNGNNKAVIGNRSMGNPYAFPSCNNSSHCTNNTNNTGNYINIMSVPLSTLQYNRKKSTSQDYQSRLYYNTTDVKCRDDYYLGNNVKRSNETTAQIQHHQIQQHQTSQNHHHVQHQLQHINQNAHSQRMQNQNQQKTACSPNSALDTIDVDCTMYSNAANAGSGGRVGAATQTHLSNANVASCDQLGSHQTPVSLVPVNVPVPPVMYTVHRVVTTAQIQTAVGSTFASSASVSSVVSAGRNENDCISSAQVTSAMSISAKDPCLHLSELSGNIINTGNSLGPLTGVRSASGILQNLLPVQQKCNSSSEAQQNPVVTKRIVAGNSSSTYTSAGKPNSIVTRTLQNVIPTCVYLMSRVAVHMEIEGTVQCPSQVMLAAALGCEELGISNKLLAQSIFGLWMTSSLLEMQLKAHHCPYIVRVAWPNLLEKFSSGTPIERKYDEPMIVLKRNVFFSKRDEEKIKDHRIVELLYEEAKHYVLTGRYIMEPVHSLMLGGIQARIELGPYNSHTHTVGFFRENQSRFLPKHVAKSSNWLWLPISKKNSAEIKLLEQFKRVPQTATTRKLMRKYLEFCWALPFYGAAFFHGQMEQPVRGIMSLVNHKDMEVLLAVNERGIFIIDCVENTLLLGLRYEDMSWDYAKPSDSEDSECLTCIFLQFDAVENGIQISKLVQVFSKQAAMIDALISHFTEQMRKKRQEGNSAEQFHDEPNPIQNNGNGILCNKLSRLTLASFDEEGRCIGQMGSLSISY
ncbi:FERM domain-containing protein 8 [Drosophila grimshawi]|uniref:FERM domain-containing protein 8 n=1 Tax=Drosophila grimshawi TaxID=7222 RepID=B4JHP7_DROGR|nr:FERM domain-containing protein 8 [Drosophila grimshawi]EDV93886.1 GH19577 [Drosophila grimshawi]